MISEKDIQEATLIEKSDALGYEIDTPEFESLSVVLDKVNELRDVLEKHINAFPNDELDYLFGMALTRNDEKGSLRVQITYPIPEWI